MALTDFFRINMPYGIVKNDKGEWLAFNREYVPIGWNDDSDRKDLSDSESYARLPIKTKYKTDTDKILSKLIDRVSQVEYDANGKICKIFLYDDGTNPKNFPENWERYMNKLKILSELEV
jgi:hypothetical protein